MKFRSPPIKVKPPSPSNEPVVTSSMYCKQIQEKMSLFTYHNTFLQRFLLNKLDNKIFFYSTENINKNEN